MRQFHCKQCFGSAISETFSDFWDTLCRVQLLSIKRRTNWFWPHSVPVCFINPVHIEFCNMFASYTVQTLMKNVLHAIIWRRLRPEWRPLSNVFLVRHDHLYHFIGNSKSSATSRMTNTGMGSPGTSLPLTEGWGMLRSLLRCALRLTLLQYWKAKIHCFQLTNPGYKSGQKVCAQFELVKCTELTICSFLDYINFGWVGWIAVESEGNPKSE